MHLLLLLACAPEPASGELVALTYNVAGLPQGISSSDPEAYIPLISPLLNAYDLVLAQEDFAYHDELAGAAEHPYQSAPKERGDRPMNDGLNRFSSFAFTPVDRQQWVACHGQLEGASDCLAEKGFSFAETTLADGVTVDVYNHHAEAGGGPEDDAARAEGVDQLLAYLDERSAGRPLIIAGDTNLSADDPEDLPLIERLLEHGGLEDACQVLDCGVDLIDRFLFRGSDTLALEPVEWRIASEFVTEDGEPLSDHNAVSVRFSFEELR